MNDLYNAYKYRVIEIRDECIEQQKHYRPIKKQRQQNTRSNWFKKRLRKLA
ncbi:hypothetical protein [Piscibacillus salipiscarius]|uniref:Transposase n=1 Tax=Piscibacillus salipiscarius TaxID=299480 RepID=A0ABW5Q7B1_9BACI|nr:hypothetical protein [Piscibacillus salipiscarius]